jgi:hypothetical protein
MSNTADIYSNSWTNNSAYLLFHETCEKNSSHDEGNVKRDICAEALDLAWRSVSLPSQKNLIDRIMSIRSTRQWNHYAVPLPLFFLFTLVLETRSWCRRGRPSSAHLVLAHCGSAGQTARITGGALAA